MQVQAHLIPGLRQAAYLLLAKNQPPLALIGHTYPGTVLGPAVGLHQPGADSQVIIIIREAHMRQIHRVVLGPRYPVAGAGLLYLQVEARHYGIPTGRIHIPGLLKLHADPVREVALVQVTEDCA